MTNGGQRPDPSRFPRLKTRWTCSSGARIRIRRARGVRLADLLMRSHVANCRSAILPTTTSRSARRATRSSALSSRRCRGADRGGNAPSAYVCCCRCCAGACNRGFLVRAQAEWRACDLDTHCGSPRRPRSRVSTCAHSPSRAPKTQRVPEPLQVPRGRVNATILLPVGAATGVYEVRILDGDLRVRASATGSAEIRNYVTTLEAAIDTSGLDVGDYQLTLRREGGEWQMFPLHLR